MTGVQTCALPICILATASVNGNLNTPVTNGNGLFKALEEGTLWIEQLKAMGLTIALSVVATVIITAVVSALVGLRPTAENEDVGLDLSEHGEEGYHG